MLWMWLVVETRKRFVLLNQFLIKLISIPERLQVNNIKATNKCEVRNEIKRITALYNELCDVVDLINDVFGAGLLISVIFTISYVLLYSIILIDFTVFKIGSSSDVWIIYTSIVWLIENFVKIMALALAGENLSSEANKTVNVCYGLINKLENSEEIRQKLIFLIQQALDRKPCLKASGFFVVKSTMTGFIVGSITSYVIVAVQFLNEMQTHVTQ
ncbi:uncharacterized protein LOC130900628 [Diorhabda carinulata]|uniref:uncharacterized protein LOC130452528 n=1 Tax=Diorhabda sublineata TaxID=1163346 RepID=UPI0024E125C5|nr:uncharacterized protein LOC130452528 [Diorhabda sublineata]XP_057667338.1 uncharacterized protein LOC130900628 [Diorhabda carinulata]